MQKIRIIFTVFALVYLLSSGAMAEQVGPWNLDVLKKANPEVSWLNRDHSIHSLTYSGEKVAGKETEVFAFYASPATLGEAEDGTVFPGIVLIHGGGGTAFAEWVHLWAKRGYAAIAMDLSGSRPEDPTFDQAGAFKQANSRKRTKLPKGGLNHGRPEKFDSIGGEIDDDWPFHALANVMRAHSLLRNLPEVDPERTAVTGISWGGYTTCLAASMDDRFKAAVPVYGCGFLHEGQSVQKPAIDALGDRKDQWVKLYDPGSHLPRCKVPILFVNGTNDKHYVLDSYMKSFNVVPGEKHIRIEHRMRHGHQPGWAPKEIGIFIDSKCSTNETHRLPVVGKPVINGDSVSIECHFHGSKLNNAELFYTSETGLREKRKWQSIPFANTVGADNKIIGPGPPPEANTWYIAITDDRDAMVSSIVLFK